MISDKENTRLSKFLSLVLRHQPESIGIVLDDNGWTDLHVLIEKANNNGVPLSVDIVKHIVETNAKKRFALNETADRIRANQGHSVDVDPGYMAQTPPEILYHGTSQKAVPDIMRSGLDKRQRHHVHLSRDIETAIRVGQRHGKPFVFEVLAGQMAEAGFIFYLSDNGIWLTDHVPVEFLKQS
jgi:putative RNA 2'-phosphotransferase